MTKRALKFCAYAGCKNLTEGRYCKEHEAEGANIARGVDGRAPASERGYDWTWHKFSKWYLAQPGHQLCALRISPRCKIIAECVDHIVPLQGKTDKGKYDMSNLQPACLACNTAKGKQIIRGDNSF